MGARRASDEGRVGEHDLTLGRREEHEADASAREQANRQNHQADGEGDGGAAPRQRALHETAERPVSETGVAGVQALAHVRMVERCGARERAAQVGGQDEETLEQ